MCRHFQRLSVELLTKCYISSKPNSVYSFISVATVCSVYYEKHSTKADVWIHLFEYARIRKRVHFVSQSWFGGSPRLCKWEHLAIITGAQMPWFRSILFFFFFKRFEFTKLGTAASESIPQIMSKSGKRYKIQQQASVFLPLCFRRLMTQCDKFPAVKSITSLPVCRTNI